MPRHRGFDDRTVIRLALRLFWERGYASTSLAQLQQATGLNKSSLYETFGSKRGLFDRAMQSYLDEVIHPLLAPLRDEHAGRQQLIDYFLTFAAVFRGPSPAEASRGCFMLNTAMELNVLDSAAAGSVNAYRVEVRTALLNASKDLDGDGRDPATRADILVAGQIGMMVISRMDATKAAELAETMATEVAGW